MGDLLHINFGPDPAAKHRLSRALYYKAVDIDDKDPEEGIYLYRRAIHFDPFFDEAMTNLGRIYFRRGQMGAAENWWERAIKTNPRATDAHYNLGYLFLEGGEYRAAIAHFEMAIGADPTFADAYFNLGEALRRMGRQPEARACWRKHVELRGAWMKEAWERLGVRLIRGGRCRESDQR